MKQEPKQIIVIRKDLNMRKGKAMSQAAHASMKVFLDLCTRHEIKITQKIWSVSSYSFAYENGSAWDEWLNGRFTKIVVSCENEEELDKLYLQAKEKKLPCSMVIDAGLTEFNGVPTKTCIAIGPAYPNEIDEITKHLKLL